MPVLAQLDGLAQDTTKNREKGCLCLPRFHAELQYQRRTAPLRYIGDDGLDALTGHYKAFGRQPVILVAIN